jgi:hypothetical protein
MRPCGLLQSALVSSVSGQGGRPNVVESRNASVHESLETCDPPGGCTLPVQGQRRFSYHPTACLSHCTPYVATVERGLYA